MLGCASATHVDEPRAVRLSVALKRMRIVEDELGYCYIVPKMFFA